MSRGRDEEEKQGETLTGIDPSNTNTKHAKPITDGVDDTMGKSALEFSEQGGADGSVGSSEGGTSEMTQQAVIQSVPAVDEEEVAGMERGDPDNHMGRKNTETTADKTKYTVEPPWHMSTDAVKAPSISCCIIS